MNADGRQLEMENRRAATPPTAEQMRSFPLIALVQLATYLAALVACVNGRQLMIVLEQAKREPLFAASAVLGACATVALIGIVIGASQLHVNRSVMIGAGVGVLYGLLILAVYVAPAAVERAAAAAAMLLITTIAFRIRAA